MADQIIHFITRWLYDLRAVLTRTLESLKDDLQSDDPEVSIPAKHKVELILRWLHPAASPSSRDGWAAAVEAALRDPTLSPEARRDAVSRAARATGRPRGRPRDADVAGTAIKALTLHYATRMAWREIALDLLGCNHKRPNLDRSCEACGEKIRDAAGRLECTLIEIGYDPRSLREVELDPDLQRDLGTILHPGRFSGPPTPGDKS